MKRFFAVIVLLLCVSSAIAQTEATETKKRSNEFGIDATSFLMQFLNPAGQPGFSGSYSPVYYVTYRHYFKPGNIRAAIGGDLLERDIDSPFVDDLNDNYHQTRRSADLRVGWEFCSELSKRWQAYYGLDFRNSLGYQKNDAVYWNGGYANGIEEHTSTFALAPLLGFRFRINNRLSLLTEASFSLCYQKLKSRTYYLPVDGQFPPKPDAKKEGKLIFSSFNQPVSLFIAFSF